MRPVYALVALLLAAPALAQERPLGLMDVFELEAAADPQLSPDGERVVYRRLRMDVMEDRQRADLWVVDADGQSHRPLVTGADAASPRWSPDGTRVAYVASDGEDGRELFVRYLDTGATVRLAQLDGSPGGLAWSPDGRRLAFSMFVEEDAEPFVALPTPPEGAEWAGRPRVIEAVQYRADGQGYLEPGRDQLFVVPADGGTPRQLTDGSLDFGGTPAWTPDGRTLVATVTDRPEWAYDPGESDLYAVDVATGAARPLTDRDGPDTSPAVSPDGRLVAFVGYDDRRQGYQTTDLYVMALDGSDRRHLAADLDRSVSDPTWSADGRGLYVQYDSEGRGRVAYVPLDGGAPETVAEDLGGLSLGRPYGGGSFSVADGRVAYTLARPDRPADVALVSGGGVRVLTDLNGDLVADRALGEVEEIWYESSADGRRVQGWVVKPPDFDPDRQYPLVLEIHGGPFANYGPRFAAEVQLFAAAGYVVLYTNPRGSTSYGEAFGNLIHHAYPSQDYDDLMSGVDAVVAEGYVDPDRLYVTGGSGGGVLTAWTVGHTDRFAAAVVAKPVVNWTSWALTADMYVGGVNNWFPALPWEAPDHYWERSPLAYVGDVTTPTMVLTGEDDVRTPMSESEQYYQALQLARVPTALVRVPGAAHGIASRPSNLIAKVAHVLAWFERYGGPEVAALTD
jgi:acylaminoacyl-peptidase